MEHLLRISKKKLISIVELIKFNDSDIVIPFSWNMMSSWNSTYMTKTIFLNLFPYYLINYSNFNTCPIKKKKNKLYDCTLVKDSQVPLWMSFYVFEKVLKILSRHRPNCFNHIKEFYTKIEISKMLETPDILISVLWIWICMNFEGGKLQCLTNWVYSFFFLLIYFLLNEFKSAIYVS